MVLVLVRGGGTMGAGTAFPEVAFETRFNDAERAADLRDPLAVAAAGGRGGNGGLVAPPRRTSSCEG